MNLVHRNSCILCVVFYFSIICLSLSADPIDLSGQWDFQIGPTNSETTSNLWVREFDNSIHLPGTASEARTGNPLLFQPALINPQPESYNPKKGLLFGRDKSPLTNSPFEHLRQTFSYIGPAFYRRKITVPDDWTNQDVELVLERVIWKTAVWVNGQYVGSTNSLTTPHRYEIGHALKPGANEIVICVDNRRQLAIGDPHAYTEQSQTIWNGIIGSIKLTARDKIRINSLELRPDLQRRGVKVTAQMHNGSGKEVAAELLLQSIPENFRARKNPELKLPITLPSGDSEQKIFYPMGTNFALWSEFNPKLYKIQALLEGENIHSEISDASGMREFKTSGRQFLINGKPVFLRGTVNCCEFPKTGYPDMTGEQWEKIFSTVKAFGLNHVRFHTWCPPEAAFEVADRYGIYLEVELPDWSFKIGEDTNVTQFFRSEGERMIHEYGNHPSWIMFTMGNELKADYSTLDVLEPHLRGLDPDLLYDSTTYPNSSHGKTPEPADDYYISQDTKNGRARGQDIFNDTAPNTRTNFESAISCIPVPFISHEVGQYCVYPSLAELPKYDGVLRSTALETIQADLQSKGRLSEAPAYTRDSGKLAALLYKEEVERALRTTNQAGFQLLQLNDFPGQGTSTVGLLDAFWDGKGLTAAKQFQKFCGPVVSLLLTPKRVFQNDETFDAGIQIANFGIAPITNATVTWKILNGRKEIGKGSFQIPLIALSHNAEFGRIQYPLHNISHATKIKVSIEISGTSIANDWDIWVYPKNEIGGNTNNIEVFQTVSPSVFKALDDGKRVLLLPTRESIKTPLAAQFVPVFWNPVMFPNQPGTMGAMIKSRHPVFADFPTDDWTDWQWWELLHNSYSINLDSINPKVEMPFRFVDKFNRNALPAGIFEAKVGNGRLLVCTLDITSDLDSRAAARQLRRSIFDYVAGDKFQPACQLSPSDLKKLFW